MSKELEELIKKGEGQNTEFKDSLSLKREIGETVSAFSNAHEGTILIGVSEFGDVTGVVIGNRTLEELANYLKINTDPQIYPEINLCQISDKYIIEVKIKENDEKPVFFKTHAFKRVGKTNQRISTSEIRKLAQEERKRLCFDERICEEASLEDIDEEKVKWYLEKRAEIRRVKKPEEMDFETLIVNIRAAKEIDGKIKPTNAGILFFGRNPQRFILQSQLRLARFAGKTLTRDFLDRFDSSGTLWEMIEQAEDFIRKNIRLFGFRTEFTFKRIDKFEYPIKAIREGVINALIHRDYLEPADTRVLIFDDRIEIVNPGKFPEGTSPENPRHIPVNPVLCQLIYDVGLIEKYGTGIYMMRETCRDYGTSEPEYELSEREIGLTFRSSGKAIIMSEIEKTGVKLNDRQKKAFKHILGEGRISTKDYCELNNVVPNTAYRDLNEMMQMGLIRRVDKGRSTHYIPIE
jgi:ATP-dependent DNA helicase RecG